MTERRTDHTRQRAGTWPELLTAIAAICAAFAPVTLTGLPVVDAIERAVLAGAVTYIGSYGRRWAWLAAAAAVTVPARGFSLALALAALAVIVVAAWPKRRSRVLGALGAGLLVNAVLWYPPETSPYAPVLAVGALALLVGSGLPQMRTTRRRVTRRVLVGLGVFALAAAVCAGIAMVLAYSSVRSGGDAARSALNSARAGDSGAATVDLTQADDHFAKAADRVEGPLASPALLVPGLSQQVQAVQTTVDQGRSITTAANDLVATADYDKLQYDGRLDLDQIAELAAPTARATTVLDHAQSELGDLSGGRLLPPLQDRIDQFSSDIADATRDTALASKILHVTPGLFGADEERRYLVIFLTPAELRGAGGFVGSYAELVASDGKVTLGRSGRIADLIYGANQGNRTLKGPADYLHRYGRYHPEDYVQDVTFSPDFPSDAEVLKHLYPQVGGSEIDGVIAVDPTGLAALLKLTGPVTVPGLDEPLTSDNAVEVLTRTQYQQLPDEAQRGDILTEATRLTFEKLTSSRLPAPRSLADTLSPAARSGHLRLWSPDAAEQAVFEQLGADGSLTVAKGSDGLSVVQQNTGNNKLDAYLHRKITYLPTIDASTGKLTAKLRIELHNDVPSLDLPPGVIGNTRGLPPGTNLTWVTIFTPNAVTAATIDGKATKLGPSSEAGLRAWDTPLIQIPPGGTVVIEADLEGGVDLTHGYRLTILPQPVANPDQFTATLTVENGAPTGASGDQVTLLDDQPVTQPTRLRAPVSASTS